jgi:putative SOS response-associated peptidase YedK
MTGTNEEPNVQPLQHHHQPGRNHRLFRAVNHNVGNLPPMPGVFPDYPAPVVRNAGADRELTMMRWGMPPPRTGGPPVTNIRNTSSQRLA